MLRLRPEKKAARRQPLWGMEQAGACSIGSLLAARDLAFHAFDVEVDAAQELVVGHSVFGQHFLACLLYTSDAADD